MDDRLTDPCLTCDGTGVEVTPVCGGGYATYDSCPECEGTGRAYDEIETAEINRLRQVRAYEFIRDDDE